MTPEVSVVLVHYRAGRLAAAALAAAAGDLAAAGLAAELLVVDNGGDEDDRSHLAATAVPARRLDPGENLGFAGGVNLGVAESTGDVIVLMNPDVTVLPGCLPALVAELGAGAGIAGPRFWWDAGRRLLLPPAEARGLADELGAALAAGGGLRARRARARWRRHARRHWTAERPLPSHALSGALLAVRRDAWERVGPFDAGYRLYFEETDWLARARRAGVAARYVPAAEAVHAHGESARREPRAAEWFAESARRFRRRHHGRLAAVALERLAGRAAHRAAREAAAGPSSGRRAAPSPAVHGAAAAAPHTGRPAAPEPRGLAGRPVPDASLAGAGPIDIAGPHAPDAPLAGAADLLDLSPWASDAPLWVEVSPRPEGFPAAAERLAAPPPGGWSLPAEVRGRQEGPLTVHLTTDAGRELARFVLAPPPAAAGAAPGAA